MEACQRALKVEEAERPRADPGKMPHAAADRFRAHLRRLLEWSPIRAWTDRDQIPHRSGVYLFSRAGDHLYVGAATGNDLRKRIPQHTPRHRTPRQGTAASLAVAIAKERTGISRGLWESEAFLDVYWTLGPVIDGMDLRFVEIDDFAEARAFKAFAQRRLQPRYNRRSRAAALEER